jgi:hypothetical protein
VGRDAAAAPNTRNVRACKMTTKDHHLLCLGLLAKLGMDSRKWGETTLEQSDLKAIREAIASGQNLGLPVV